MKNECIRVYTNIYDYEKVANMDIIKKYDDYAKNNIMTLRAAISRIEEYRTKLFEHAQKLATSEYTLEVSIKREKRYWRDNRVFYYIAVNKVYDGIGTTGILSETYTGIERNKALSRFDELCKEYPVAKHIKNIEKGKWEK